MLPLNTVCMRFQPDRVRSAHKNCIGLRGREGHSVAEAVSTQVVRSAGRYLGMSVASLGLRQGFHRLTETRGLKSCR